MLTSTSTGIWRLWKEAKKNVLLWCHSTSLSALQSTRMFGHQWQQIQFGWRMCGRMWKNRFLYLSFFSLPLSLTAVCTVAQADSFDRYGYKDALYHRFLFNDTSGTSIYLLPLNTNNIKRLIGFKIIFFQNFLMFISWHFFKP